MNWLKVEAFIVPLERNSTNGRNTPKFSVLKAPSEINYRIEKMGV